MICKHTMSEVLSVFSKLENFGRYLDGFRYCKLRRQESRLDWRVDQRGGICGGNDIISSHVPCHHRSTTIKTKMYGPDCLGFVFLKADIRKQDFLG